MYWEIYSMVIIEVLNTLQILNKCLLSKKYLRCLAHAVSVFGAKVDLIEDSILTNPITRPVCSGPFIFPVPHISGLVRRIDSMAALDEIAIDIFADNVFNEGHEVAVLEFTNSENRPEFLFGANPITQIVIIDRSA